MPRPARFLAPLLAILAILPSASRLRAEPPKAPPAITFLRTQAPAEGMSALQTLSAEYRPASGVGPSIWLIGVAHLGTADYYASLQKRLDRLTRVLYEGVGADRLAEGAKPDNSAGLQGKLAQSLGLVFQLDGIDYHRRHFVNSDLTAEGLNAAIERRASEAPPVPDKPDAKVEKSEPGAPATPAKKSAELPARVNKETFDQLMQALQGEGEMAESLNAMIGLLGSTPAMRETTKLIFIEALGQAGELIELAKASSPDMKGLFEVLITERNAEVSRHLDRQLKQLGAGDSVAIFYGAAHMDEFARRVTEELHYIPASQTWDTAFTADSRQSVMPPAQIKMMMQMMRTQLQNPDALEAPAGEQPAFPLFNLLPPTTPAPKAKEPTKPSLEKPQAEKP